MAVDFALRSAAVAARIPEAWYEQQKNLKEVLEKLSPELLRRWQMFELTTRQWVTFVGDNSDERGVLSNPTIGRYLQLGMEMEAARENFIAEYRAVAANSGV